MFDLATTSTSYNSETLSEEELELGRPMPIGISRVIRQKPPFLSYEQLVFLALKNACFDSLTMLQIYGFLQSTFTCFRPVDSYWKANVDRAVLDGKLTGTFETNFTAKNMDAATSTVKMADSRISELDKQVDDWRSQFTEENIDESRFSSLEELQLVCEGAMGFLPPPPVEPQVSPADLISELRRIAPDSHQDLPEDAAAAQTGRKRNLRPDWKPKGVPCKNCRLDNRQLSSHMREVHGYSEDQIKKYRKKLKKQKKYGTRFLGIDCPICDEFLSVLYIRTHMRNMHSMAEREICNILPRKRNYIDWPEGLHPTPRMNEVQDEREMSSGGDSVEHSELLEQPSPSPPELFTECAPPLPTVEGLNALDLLQEDHHLDNDLPEEVDVKPDKNMLDLEMQLGTVPNTRKFVAPDPALLPAPGHCMVCMRRIGRKQITQHLRTIHEFGDEDVLQYMLVDEKRSLKCPGCERFFKSHLSLRLHQRFCSTGTQQQGQLLVLPQQEDTKPVICPSF